MKFSELFQKGIFGVTGAARRPNVTEVSGWGRWSALLRSNDNAFLEPLMSLGGAWEPRLSNSVRSALRSCRLCLFIAFANLMQNRVRFLVAAGGTAVPILLLVMQIASLDAVRQKVSSLYDAFDFDIAIVSDSYQFLFASGTFDRVRLSQASAVPGVAESFALNIGSTRWGDIATDKYSPVMVIGLDQPGHFVRDPAIGQGFRLLRSSRDVLADSYSSSDLGSVETGTLARLTGRTVEVAGQFQLGLFFYADGSVVVPNTDFPAFTGHAPTEVSVGLVKLAADADPGTVRNDLAAALPQDVRVLQRSELIDEEEGYFLSTKPLGIMMRISMLIAFVVGSVILLQVLSADVVNRIDEFATLKAIGYSSAFVLGVGLCETFGLVLSAFVPALLVGAVLLGIAQWTTHLQTAVTPYLVVRILFIVLCMCFVSGITVVRRIVQADPAELY